MKTGSFVVIVVALLFVVSMPSTAGAYGGLTHEWIMIQGFDLFKCPGPESCTTCPQHYYPELEFPLDNNRVPPWLYLDYTGNWFSSQLVGGGGEDSHNHVGWDLPVDNTVSHFWNGDDGNELATNDFLGGVLYDIPNALDNARRLVRQARELYLNNQKTGDPGAYDLLSHAIHLIEDMTVPAHAHVIDHGLLGDSYDDWCRYEGNDDTDSGTFSKNHAQWTSDHARAAGGPVVIPKESAEAAYTSILQNYNDGPWPPLSPGADLYYLIYTANQYGDYFGSQGTAIGNGADGDDDERRGWVNYGAPPFSSLDDPPGLRIGC